MQPTRIIGLYYTHDDMLKSAGQIVRFGTFSLVRLRP
jgi:hypothetical protein